MYLDPYLLPLAVGMQSPCSVSGIYFRPTFHYPNFSNYTPSWKDWLQQWREKFILNRVLRHPQLKTLFCLDPFAVKHINNYESQVRAIHLPDPVLLQTQDELKLKTLREKLGIKNGKQVFRLKILLYCNWQIYVLTLLDYIVMYFVCSLYLASHL